MAYNPFNIFRRNQRVIFAVLTVFIMIMFTLSSGVVGGDFFEWVPRWLGAKSKKGDVVCVIDGTKVTESELTGSPTSLRFRRMMANRYMSYAASQTASALDEKVSAGGRLSPEGEKVMAGVRQAETMLQIAFQSPQFAQQIDVQSQFAVMRTGLSQMINSQTLRSEDKEIARAKLAILTIQQTSGRGEQYFQNAQNNTLPDLVNFLLWQKKADQLGIYYTSDDVKRLVQAEFFGEFTAPSQVVVQKAMLSSMQGFTIDACLKAVGEEFRVRAAQTVVLGDIAHSQRWDKTKGGFPSFNAPFDTFDFYRDETSPTTYAAIPVPAENFLASVPDPNWGDPAVRDELKKLYQKYKDDEPNPGKDTPGFKNPRKVRVAWFSITGTEPYYTQMVEERLKLGPPTAKAGGMLTVPVFGTSPALLAAAVAPTAAKDALIEEEFKHQNRTPGGQSVEYSQHHNFQVDLRWGKSIGILYEPLGLLLDTSVIRPGNLAVGAGGFAGQFLGFGNPFAATAALGAGPIAYEIRDRAKAGIPLALSAVPGWGFLQSSIGGSVAYQAMTPKPVSIDVQRPELMKDLAARNARELAVQDVRKLMADWGEQPESPARDKAEPPKKRDKDEAKKAIAEFAARRGLTVAESQTPRGEWKLEEEPALAPLVAAQRNELRAAATAHGMQQQRGYVPFGEKFFWSTGRRNPTTGVFQPMYYPTEVALGEEQLKEKPQYLVWRTSDEPAGKEQRVWSDNPNDELSKDVVRAWKMNEARKRAKEKADQIAKTINESGNLDTNSLYQAVKEVAGKFEADFADPKARARVAPFMIHGVTPLTTVADPAGQKGFEFGNLFASTAGPLQPFRLPSSENLKYPTEDLAKALMTNRTKGPKTVEVLLDGAKDTYFVTTLLKREVKSEEHYRIEVASHEDRGDPQDMMGGAMGMRNQDRRLVLAKFRDQSQRNAYQSVIGLLKKEFKYEATDEQKMKLETSADRRIDD